ncbi:UDP-N-acetylenolpyruvoylglucosamine reductase [Striga asiatica]|uniref:UDP-N-acetylenolpyruvoylglucosamine reductase n=1 Tax=Striga asiatica TaxID=4170 RepID=A0A5A7P4Q7_STRAF|nr:UDP-N-acetylenolpyruvoylglucosamine reductase [Striga asiatica]
MSNSYSCGLRKSSALQLLADVFPCLLTPPRLVRVPLGTPAYLHLLQTGCIFKDPRDMVEYELDYFTVALELKGNKIVGTQLDLLHPSALLDVEMLQSKRPKQADRMRSSAPSSRVTLLNLRFRRDILVCNLGKHGQV